MRHHNLRGSQPTSSHLQKNPNFNSLKWHHHSIQQSSIYKTQKIRLQTMSHVLPEGPLITSVISRAHTRRFGPPTRLHDASRAHTRPSSSMTSLPTFSLTRFVGPDLNRWPGPNRLRKKCFDQVWPLTLTKKSKISKKGLLSFLRTFQFWNLFLCSRLWNCANYPISKKLTFA